MNSPKFYSGIRSIVSYSVVIVNFWGLEGIRFSFLGTPCLNCDSWDFVMGCDLHCGEVGHGRWGGC